MSSGSDGRHQPDDGTAGAGPESRVSRELGGFDARVESVRTDPRRRRIALLGAVLVGWLVAWTHWLGLVLAGALVGVTRATTPRAVLASAGFGLATVLATPFVAPEIGPAEFVALTPVNYLTVVTALAASSWGGLVRWVV